MVAEFPFEDHQAPTMDLIYSLCEDLVYYCLILRIDG